jgi:hypothetical protein
VLLTSADAHNCTTLLLHPLSGLRGDFLSVFLIFLSL